MAKRKKKKRFRVLRLLLKLQILFFLVIGTAVAYYYFGGYAKEVGKMRDEAVAFVKASDEETFRTNQTSVVYAADGSVISMLKGERDSYYIQIEDIPAQAVAAIVSIEDKKFYRHDGIDYRALLRAVKAMLENGEATQGGSTITMQLARNTFLTQEKTWQRKIEEMFIARELERKYSKDDILEFYLNNIYFGNGYYGIQAASRGYLNRDVQELDLSQLAFLCAIPNNPTLYDPVDNMDNTIKRRNRILKNMMEDGKISELNYAEAIVETIVLERPAQAVKNDYVETYAYYCATRALMELEGFVFQNTFTDEAEENAYDESYQSLYGACQKKLYTEGYQIFTSLDLNLQEELQDAVNETLADFTDVNEEGIYQLQASAACIDNDTGYVKAIVGGRAQEYAGYTLNRAYQSFRQPGSAIKPLIVYTPVFGRGYEPDTLVMDEEIEDGPKNSNGTYLGEVTVRTAVEKSINTIAWKLYEELTPEVGLAYLKAMNFARLDAEDYRPATALGGFTNGVSALEMAAGYAAIENDGIYRAPTCIINIVNAEGEQIYVSSQSGSQVYKQNAARMMTNVLSGVMLEGTAKGLDLGEMPSAGKTGTTNDQKDGWFVGYTRYYTTSVWVGYDMPKKLNDLMGSTYPGTIWKSFMESAHQNLEPLDFLSYIKLNGDYSQSFFTHEAEGAEEAENEEGAEAGADVEDVEGAEDAENAESAEDVENGADGQVNADDGEDMVDTGNGAEGGSAENETGDGA